MKRLKDIVSSVASKLSSCVSMFAEFCFLFISKLILFLFSVLTYQFLLTLHLVQVLMLLVCDQSMVFDGSAPFLLLFVA